MGHVVIAERRACVTRQRRDLYLLRDDVNEFFLLFRGKEAELRYMATGHSHYQVTAGPNEFQPERRRVGRERKQGAYIIPEVT